MPSDATPSLKSLTQRFPEVLAQLAAAAGKDATAATQASAFKAACDLTTQLVTTLEAAKDIDLEALDASLRTFLVSVPPAQVEAFLDKEAAVLRALGLTNGQVAMALAALREAIADGALREARLDGRQVLQALRVLRDTCCQAQTVADRGWKLSAETIELGLLAVGDACIIVGDYVSIPVGATAGPLGLAAATLLAVGSVAGGLHSLMKRLDRLRGRLKQDEEAVAAQREHEAAMKAVRDAGPPERFKLNGNKNKD